MRRLNTIKGIWAKKPEPTKLPFKYIYHYPDFESDRTDIAERTDITYDPNRPEQCDLYSLYIEDQNWWTFNQEIIIWSRSDDYRIVLSPVEWNSSRLRFSDVWICNSWDYVIEFHLDNWTTEQDMVLHMYCMEVPMDDF